MKPIILIPARWGSTRFPGKPLALLDGHPIIEHVWRRALSVTPSVYIATDDERIVAAVEGFGGKAIMTRSDHRSGTDRIAEVMMILEEQYDVVVNIQGDEPFIAPSQVKTLITQFEDPSVSIATLSCPCSSAEIVDPNVVKIVTNRFGNALYFSRCGIPYVRGVEQDDWRERFPFQKHIGMYAYRAEVLQQLTRLEPSPLEKAESLEQLRWLENGYVIRVVETDKATIGIDTPEDLAAAEVFIQEHRDY